VQGFPALDFDDYHRHVLPPRCRSALGRAAARDVEASAPIAFVLTDGRAYRFVPAGDTIAIEPRADAPVVVELAPGAWSDFVHELHTSAGLLYGGHARFLRGDAAQLERWEPALRALFSARPILDPARLELRDRAGAPLDLHRHFTLADADDDMRHFLAQTGYLLVKRVFTAAELAPILAAVARVQAGARPSDGRSWWARRADATNVLCRLIYVGLTVPEIAALNDDPRLRRFAALARDGLRPTLDRCDGHSVVIKNAGAVEGLSDLPWHRDCGLGGHPVTCPAVNVGLQLDAATADSGRLEFVPGSWRGSCHRRDLAGAPLVAVDTEPGDCTIHLGDVLHAAPPPAGTGAGRRALYVTFLPPAAFEVIPPGRSYNDTIRARVGG
jgi:ectoine hydroxylase-related dioxygenase (phytanoyl-CoA dioxygenase family)